MKIFNVNKTKLQTEKQAVDKTEHSVRKCAKNTYTSKLLFSQEIKHGVMLPLHAKCKNYFSSIESAYFLKQANTNRL